MRMPKETRRVLALAMAKRCRKGMANCPVSGDCPFPDLACALVKADDWEEHVGFVLTRRKKKA